jgi:hypothetical protein
MLDEAINGAPYSVRARILMVELFDMVGNALVAGKANVLIAHRAEEFDRRINIYAEKLARYMALENAIAYRGEILALVVDGFVFAGWVFESGGSVFMPCHDSLLT